MIIKTNSHRITCYTALETMLARIMFFTIFLFTASLLHAADSEGERLTYALGCVNCHHQTPKDIINAPPLIIVQAYSKEQFEKLLTTGVTMTDRNLSDIGSIMGIIAVEQFSYLTQVEILEIYNFLRNEWTHEKALNEEAKIPSLYRTEESNVE